jgi:hypothetical protein
LVDINNALDIVKGKIKILSEEIVGYYELKKQRQ